MDTLLRSFPCIQVCRSSVTFKGFILTEMLCTCHLLVGLQLHVFLWGAQQARCCSIKIATVYTFKAWLVIQILVLEGMPSMPSHCSSCLHCFIPKFLRIYNITGSHCFPTTTTHLYLCQTNFQLIELNNVIEINSRDNPFSVNILITKFILGTVTLTVKSHLYWIC